MKRSKNDKLYFVALVPPEPVYSEVEAMKRRLSSEFNTKASLKSPPHITLHMPFTFSEQRENEIFGSLQQVKMDRPLNIELSGFGSFPPRVLYIKVQSTVALIALQKKVEERIRRGLKVIKETGRKEGFSPHMTVAFRDLRPAMFRKAWASLQSADFSFQWEAQSFCLLKHNGTNWVIFKEFSII